MIPRTDDLEPGEPDKRPKAYRARKAGKARQALLLARTSAFPIVVIELANSIMGPRSTRRMGPSAERVATLAERYGERIGEVLRRRLQPGAHFRATASPLTLVPFVIAAFHLARMLWMLSRAPHAPSIAFMEVSYQAEDALESWSRAGDSIFEKPRERAAWDSNCGAAAGWLEVLRNRPPRVLALVRQCENRACPGPFFLHRSGRREPRFCPRGGCRQAFHRRRPADD